MDDLTEREKTMLVLAVMRTERWAYERGAAIAFFTASGTLLGAWVVVDLIFGKPINPIVWAGLLAFFGVQHLRASRRTRASTEGDARG